MNCSAPLNKTRLLVTLSLLVGKLLYQPICVPHDTGSEVDVAIGCANAPVTIVIVCCFRFAVVTWLVLPLSQTAYTACLTALLVSVLVNSWPVPNMTKKPGTTGELGWSDTTGAAVIGWLLSAVRPLLNIQRTPQRTGLGFVMSTAHILP